MKIDEINGTVSPMNLGLENNVVLRGPVTEHLSAEEQHKYRQG